MKITFMLYDKPNYFGGPTTNSRRLLPALVQRGYEIHAMIFFHQESSTSRFLDSRGVQCHVLKKPRYTRDQIRWILEKLKELEPDIFVPNIFVSGWYAAKWAKQAGIPSIAAHRSNDSYHWGMVDEFIVGSPDWAIPGLLCVSQSVCSQIERLSPKHTMLRAIPSGVPLPSEQSKQIGPLKIVYVGRLIQKQKRVKETLAALLNAVRQLPEIRVTFIGDGPERAYLERTVAESGFKKKIEIIGSIPTEKLSEELLNHHVLVLLSEYEGTPGAVMDAMACGLIPICSNISGGVQELVKHNKTGLLVNDFDVDFIRAIRLLSENTVFRQCLAHGARQHVVRNYSLSITVEKWEAFCKDLLAASQPKQPMYIPKRFDLPSVHPSLASQDRRVPFFLERLLSIRHRVITMMSTI
ncbi:MAG: glycosyltransferase family 4 protein [Cyanobacteria bacterium J06560_6]